ncbi:NDR1/HIN1-like protein 12 [Cinnamomum micranthum f. kanehirae]|uniref:NDR1/HIN1-like protein 12 n=1 Tax=Cinnamomum micranthum f. kanehirae TaxID=337451 RepID=A0A3S3NRA9_9MAGN|nr:NDR1/HIN1-like protein 12 [Cinnamomum micranthum f. kanehirae]
MSAKGECGKHGHGRKKKLYKRLFYSLLAFIILIILTVFIIWLVLRPSKPTFTLQEATIYQLNATSPNTISTTLQVTLSSRNPNSRIGIYYDLLQVYASYHDQQITLPSTIPATYQGHNDLTLWSPVLYGTTIPVAPFVAAALSQEEAAGYIVVTVKVDGKLRWKVGSWVSGHYHVYVTCPAYVAYDSSGGTGLRLQQTVGCSTDV